jgi:hypothetical protein
VQLPSDLVLAIDRYERVRGGVRTRELILAEMLLTMLLRRHGKMVEHGGRRYAYDPLEDSVARLEVIEPRRGDGKLLPRKIVCTKPSDVVPVRARDRRGRRRAGRSGH